MAGSAVDVLRQTSPDVLLLDDPSRVAALEWRRAAARLRISVVSVHDLGTAFCGADLAIDGSLVLPRAVNERLLAGPRFAILDRSVRQSRGANRDPGTVLIALGGGPRVGVAVQLASAIRAARPTVRIRVAGGFAATGVPAMPGVTFLGPLDGLAPELARCAVAVTGGGVSLYESIALDTPTVVWPVVGSQHPTARAFAGRQLADAVFPGPGRLRRGVMAVLAALDAKPRRTSKVIDGLGAERAAAAIEALVRETRSRRAA